MKHQSFRVLSYCIAALALGDAGAHATLNGYNVDPGGLDWDRGDANTGYAVFDLFTAWQFNPTAAATGFGITAPVWSQANAYLDPGAGGGLYDKQTSVPASGNDVASPGGTNPGINGDVLFGGANPLNFTLEGTVSFGIRGVVLQMKRPGSTGTWADANGVVPTISINGGAPIRFDSFSTSTITGDTSSDTGTSAVTSFYWNTSLAGLTEGAVNSYAISIVKGTAGVFGTGPNRGIDGFEIDLSSTSVVPEPASGALIACGMGVVVLLRRRRLASQFNASNRTHSQRKSRQADASAFLHN